MSVVYAKPLPITVVGGGDVSHATLSRALSLAPSLVAADGGADRALALGFTPDLVVGDLDSLTPAARQNLGPQRLHHVPEQDSTDFDKTLAATDAPLTLAVGFTGTRLDHTLAAMSSLVRSAHKRVVLDSGVDLCVVLPPRLRLSLPIGARLSLYPLGPCACESEGLRWPIQGLAFDPLSLIGTSNEVSAPQVELRAQSPAMLLLLPSEFLDALLTGLAQAPLWPKPARAG